MVNLQLPIPNFPKSARPWELEIGRWELELVVGSWELVVGSLE